MAIDTYFETKGDGEMADITMCNNEGCQMKNKCYRYVAEPSKFQSYFANPKEDCEKLDYSKFIEV